MDKLSQTPSQSKKLDWETLQIKIIIIWSILASLAWVTFFATGLLVESKPYRDCLKDEFHWSQLLACIFTYTPTNIALLCLTAAYLGGCASKLIVHNIEKQVTEKMAISEKTSSHIYMSESPLSSMLRGIVIYFAFIGGVCVAGTTIFIAPTPDAYVKSAGFVSLLSFIVGYDPTMFHSFINLAEKVNGKGK